jgi:RNA polymerase sigma-70 factor, ECF subfamily
LGEPVLSNFEIGLDFIENEVALVDRLQVGSEEAFETLMHLYKAPVYNIAYRVLGDPSEAADAVQETFLKIYKGIKSFRGECGLKTWIYKIAISETLNRQRWWKRWRRRATVSLDQPVGLGQGSSVPFEPPDSHPGPEAYIVAKETEQAVQRALGQLNLEFRLVIVLRDIEGLSYEDVSETLGISLGTVKSRLWRGRLELKKELHEFVNGRG